MNQSKDFLDKGLLGYALGLLQFLGHFILGRERLTLISSACLWLWAIITVALTYIIYIQFPALLDITRSWTSGWEVTGFQSEAYVFAYGLAIYIQALPITAFLVFDQLAFVKPKDRQSRRVRWAAISVACLTFILSEGFTVYALNARSLASIEKETPLVKGGRVVDVDSLSAPEVAMYSEQIARYQKEIDAETAALAALAPRIALAEKRKLGKWIPKSERDEAAATLKDLQADESTHRVHIRETQDKIGRAEAGRRKAISTVSRAGALMREEVEGQMVWALGLDVFKALWAGSVVAACLFLLNIFRNAVNTLSYGERSETNNHINGSRRNRTVGGSAEPRLTLPSGSGVRSRLFGWLHRKKGRPAVQEEEPRTYRTVEAEQVHPGHPEHDSGDYSEQAADVQYEDEAEQDARPETEQAAVQAAVQAPTIDSELLNAVWRQRGYGTQAAKDKYKPHFPALVAFAFADEVDGMNQTEYCHVNGGTINPNSFRREKREIVKILKDMGYEPTKN